MRKTNKQAIPKKRAVSSKQAFFPLTWQNIGLFIFVWGCVGFTLGTETLMGPVRWIAAIGRSRQWNPSSEEIWVKSLILLLIVISFILALILTLIWHRARMSRMTRRLKSEAAMERFFNLKGISPREREIILLILSGKSNKQIEDELFISLGTVKNHVFNIYRKLDVNSRVNLVNLFKEIPFN